MKLVEPLRTALIETLKRQTAEMVKLGYSTDNETVYSDIDEYGTTEKQREMISYFVQHSVLQAMLAALAVNPNLLSLGTEGLSAYVKRLLENRGKQNFAKLLPLAALYMIRISGGGGSDFPLIVTHQDKGTWLQSNGAAENGQITVKDSFRLCKDEEIVAMVDSLTEQQIATIINHRYFESVRLDALMVEDAAAETAS
jgi:hypothetical protein